MWPQMGSSLCFSEDITAGHNSLLMPGNTELLALLLTARNVL